MRSNTTILRNYAQVVLSDFGSTPVKGSGVGGGRLSHDGSCNQFHLK